ncbi:Maf family protein [Piscinibacter koreensis]|uniref:dTTP/UTP pyrophosphatase n=1 Tax=Piscinibacter koreensis TaxID=2742824 RepID=A0A7Y6TVR5_9BURK|nr:nucleoside triphosphate pyrophosphatase [Schlegelella koreensis]NUZ05315.1 septum formation inhibitor Maf [Schlegelella koreensis]
MARREPAAFVYLASQSPRRAELLRQLGVAHRPLLPEPHEDAEALEHEIVGERPDAYVERVTRAKLAAAHRRLRRIGAPPAPIVCADTTVALGRRIFGKPADADDAARTLRALAGRTHRVITAVAIGAGRREWVAVSVSKVHVVEMTDADIAGYIASGEPFGKAGAYAIQGAAAAWIDRIDGSYTGIMGLPLYETAQLLRAAGVAIGSPAPG